MLATAVPRHIVFDVFLYETKREAPALAKFVKAELCQAMHGGSVLLDDGSPDYLIIPLHSAVYRDTLAGKWKFMSVDEFREHHWCCTPKK